MKYILQLDETDCGAACLAMVASHYKTKQSISSIRQIAGTDRQGTNLAGMVKAAEALGFEAKALRGNADALKTGLPLPFIAHTQKVTDKGLILHFVVVYDIGDKTIKIADPGEGKLSLSRDDFMKEWTGYAVFMSPKSDFVPRKETKGLFSRFLPLLHPYTGALVEVGVASLLLIVFGILGSLYFRYLIDEVIFSRAQTTLTVLSIGVLVLTLFQVLLGAVRNHILLHFSLKVDFGLIFSYFRHVLRLPISFFDSRKTGEILSRMEDAQKIRGALSEAAISVVMDSLMVLVVGVVLFFQARTLFWIAILVVPLSSLVVWLYSKPYARRYRELMGESAEVQSYLVESINGSATVKALNASGLVYGEYEKRQMKAVWTGYRLGVAQNIQSLFVSLIDGWGNNVLFWVGSYLILKDQMSLGQLVSFNALLGYFIDPLKRLLNLQPHLQEAFVAADRLGEILDLPEEIPSDGRWLRPEVIHGCVEAKNISFRYGTRRLVLDGVDFAIEPGTWAAFVGPSGCGKTSLVKLLLKFYEPESGELRLDGNNIGDIDTVYLRSRVGYVPQEVFLFSGTIAENIALHQPEASLDSIVEAANRAGAHDFIVDLPQRYNTVLSERGASLSGGERQRLALARALLGNPELLIFDEATSNLDSISERLIHKTLEGLRDSKTTTIVIAHRLSTVMRCDRIFVMESGKIVESGRHDELVRAGGLYARLWEESSL
jgi:ATP-binding cassette subfamily B protein